MCSVALNQRTHEVDLAILELQLTKAPSCSVQSCVKSAAVSLKRGVTTPMSVTPAAGDPEFMPTTLADARTKIRPASPHFAISVLEAGARVRPSPPRPSP